MTKKFANVKDEMKSIQFSIQLTPQMTKSEAIVPSNKRVELIISRQLENTHARHLLF